MTLACLMLAKPCKADHIKSACKSERFFQIIQHFVSKDFVSINQKRVQRGSLILDDQQDLARVYQTLIGTLRAFGQRSSYTRTPWHQDHRMVLPLMPDPSVVQNPQSNAA